jgi:hypothetical protein
VPRRLGVTVTALAAVGSALLGGCGRDGGQTIIKFVSSPPHLYTLDLGAHGKSRGDVYVFDSTLFDRHGGRVIGSLHGTQTSIKLENGAETVQGILTFSFGHGDALVVGGLSQFPRIGTGTIVNRKFVRAVLGGTGKYATAAGTLTSKRRPDGSYEQEFRIKH